MRAGTGWVALHPFDGEGVARAPLGFYGGPCDPEPRVRSTPGGPSARPPLSVARLTRIGPTPGLTLRA